MIVIRVGGAAGVDIGVERLLDQRLSPGIRLIDALGFQDIRSARLADKVDNFRGPIRGDVGSGYNLFADIARRVEFPAIAGSSIDVVVRLNIRAPSFGE